MPVLLARLALVAGGLYVGNKFVDKLPGEVTQVMLAGALLVAMVKR